MDYIIDDNGTIKLDYRKCEIEDINGALKLFTESDGYEIAAVEISNICPDVLCEAYNTSFDTEGSYDMDWDADFDFDGTRFLVSGSARYGNDYITLDDE